jgi:hypothetical protein
MPRCRLRLTMDRRLQRIKDHSIIPTGWFFWLGELIFFIFVPGRNMDGVRTSLMEDAMAKNSTVTSRLLRLTNNNRLSTTDIG